MWLKSFAPVCTAALKSRDRQAISEETERGPYIE